MSQEEEFATDDATECWIDTNAVTRSTTKMHRIRWTIENVSQLPLDTKIIGPDFNLIKNCLCNISFQKSVGNLFVYLTSMSAETIKIERNLLLFDCEGRNLHQEEMGQAFTLQKNSDVDIISDVKPVRRFASLKDDILIIDCRLKVEGCITTEKSFSMSTRITRDRLVNDLKTLFNDPVHADFTLRVGDELILVHKALLRARSAYFKKMFEIEMQESIVNFVSITDVSHSTMMKLVEFLYTGDLSELPEDDNNVQQIADVYSAADKYEVTDLRDLCAEKLISIATADSICQILLLAHRHNDEGSKIRAMCCVSFHFDEIEKSTAWRKLISNEVALASEVVSFCFKRLKRVF